LMKGGIMEWIKISEGLPSVEGKYLVFVSGPMVESFARDTRYPKASDGDDHSFIAIGYYKGSGDLFDRMGVCNSEVTHWQPLPSFPEALCLK